jgi:hypothetical protein
VHVVLARDAKQPKLSREIIFRMRKTETEPQRREADGAEVIPLRRERHLEAESEGREPNREVADEGMAALSRLLDEPWSC